MYTAVMSTIAAGAAVATLGAMLYTVRVLKKQVAALNKRLEMEVAQMKTRLEHEVDVTKKAVSKSVMSFARSLEDSIV